MRFAKSSRMALVLACVSTVLSARSAVAQQSSAGIALNRYEPAERGSDWFSADSLDLRGHGRLILGVTGDWAHKPLVLFNPDGSEYASVVQEQIFAHVGAGLVLWERLRLGVNVPIFAYHKGQNVIINGERFGSTSDNGIGDLRAGADVRLVGEYQSPFSLAFGVQAFFPTGSQGSFSGDGSFRLLPRLNLAGDLGLFVYSAGAGFFYRDNDVRFADSSRGSEVVYNVAAGVRVADKRLVIGPELFGATVVSNIDAAFRKRTTPVELIFGAHYKVASDWKIGAGAGPGLSRGLGAPELRVLLSLDWVPDVKEEPPPLPPEPADRDHDGILDDADACPDEAGVRSDDPSKNGCPLPKDRDKDGILDADDACPDEAGVKRDDPKKNGCPLTDKDGDSIYDDDDACIDIPGVRTEDPKTNGCPGDRDKDGILDKEDACPEIPGPQNSDPKKNGCPAARIEEGQIKILDRVEFEYNKTKIIKRSEPVLEAVLKILQEHPEITRVSVEGHTDSKGNAGYNKKLSKQRAAAIVSWLISHGIEAKKLESVGLGMERPLDSNDSEEGRQNNRRVEFHILEINGKPAATQTLESK